MTPVGNKRIKRKRVRREAYPRPDQPRQRTRKPWTALDFALLAIAVTSGTFGLSDWWRSGRSVPPRAVEIRERRLPPGFTLATDHPRSPRALWRQWCQVMAAHDRERARGLIDPRLRAMERKVGENAATQRLLDWVAGSRDQQPTVSDLLEVRLDPSGQEADLVVRRGRYAHVLWHAVSFEGHWFLSAFERR